MGKITRPRELIDRKRLVAGLQKLESTAPDLRGATLGMFREALETGRAEIRRRFEKGEADGAETYKNGAYLLDQLVLSLHEAAVSAIAAGTTGANAKKPSLKKPSATGMTPDMAIVATGGYGRAEIAPYSDIDLMFLFKRKPGRGDEKVVEWMLYMLWDLGLKVGHATRTLNEAIKVAREDVTIMTSLLDARMVTGSVELFGAFLKRFGKEMLAADKNRFVKAKLDERDRRHERMGDSRYVLEPNIKEGKGGLRDLQTLYWIARSIFKIDNINELVGIGAMEKSDAKRFTKAQDFLWTVRCHLHFIAGRAEETLGFNVQGELARRMGYRNRQSSSGVERFMKHYFLVAKDVGDLTRVICALLEEKHAKKASRKIPLLRLLKNREQGFEAEAGRISITSEKVIKENPLNILKLFAEASRLDADIHPEALSMVFRNLGLIDGKFRRDKQANEIFMGMLTDRKNPALCLRRMNEAGVMGKFVPDFGRVVAQMQYDMYHVYTVDEHTINAIDILGRIERGELEGDHPLATQIIEGVRSRRALYVAVLLHDIAKGRGGDHSQLGAEVAKKLCPRFGLDEWESETVAWLVLHHLDMSRTAFKRDIDDPQTISDFVATVQSPERLRLLLILTVVDIRAVGPNVWNGWKASLLRELYYRAQEALTGNAPGARAQARAREKTEQLAKALSGPGYDWDDGEITNHLALGNNEYWLGFDLEHLLSHAALVRRARDNDEKLVVETVSAPGLDITEVLVHTADHPGLFARIAGAMSSAGASIVDARVVTLGNGMALDTFWIQDAGASAFAGDERMKRLEQKISDALIGKLNPKPEIENEKARHKSSRTSVFKVAPRVSVDNKLGKYATVIEINARNRSGLLHDVTWAMTGLGLQITSAHISTYGERAVDVFYVKDVFGLKVEQPAKIEKIEKALLAVISEGEEARAAG